MRNYIIAPAYKEGDLIHTAEGVQRATHKYIDRVKTASGKWRYIYNVAQKKAGRGLQKAKYAIQNEKKAQHNLRNVKQQARIREALTTSENGAKNLKVIAENNTAIQGAKDRTALGKLRKNAGNVIKKKLNKGLDWLEHNKIFSVYNESTVRNANTGKVLSKSVKKKRFKTTGPNKSGR